MGKVIVITGGSDGLGRTLTESLSQENDVIICLQRTIYNIYEQIIEPQEYQLKKEKNVDIYAIIATKIVEIINGK